jgi:hypothetical protein
MNFPAEKSEGRLGAAVPSSAELILPHRKHHNAPSDCRKKKAKQAEMGGMLQT